MKKIIKRTVAILSIALLAIALFVCLAILRSKTYTIPEQKASIENTTGLVQAHGRSLYDTKGQPLQLRGINAGQVLLQEGWMSPFALEPLKHEDGSFVTDGDGNLQYPEFSEEQFRAGLAANPNLKDHDTDALLSYYYNCAFSEEDFTKVKELGFNTIRLPFYWRNILNEDLSLKDEEDAFRYLDWFIGQAAQQELYVILDLHGAPGSQSGYEHSGTAERVAGLWTSPENMDATVELWRFVARHYGKTKPDLGAWIATYDIMNEPTIRYKGTTRECWDLFDRIYDAPGPGRCPRDHHGGLLGLCRPSRSG